MRNVIYADTDSGYACAECGELIRPDEMFEDRWHCGHSAYVEEDNFACETCKYEFCAK